MGKIIEVMVGIIEEKAEKWWDELTHNKKVKILNNINAWDEYKQNLTIGKFKNNSESQKNKIMNYFIGSKSWKK